MVQQLLGYTVSVEIELVINLSNISHLENVEITIILVIVVSFKIEIIKDYIATVSTKGVVNPY